MTLYKGSQKIQDTGSYGVFKGSQPIGAIYKGNEKVYLFKRVFTWDAGTTLAEYKVPNYVSKIQVDCVASKGQTTGANGGKGGRVQCELNVTGGQTLYITVGDIPAGSAIYNASDIRTNNSGVNNNTSLQSRLIVAGGGGSGGIAQFSNGAGGAGGGLTGEKGYAGGGGQGGGGGGGTQSDGGAGGTSQSYYGGGPGEKGKFGLGGSYRSLGGAGWYGGGGGGSGSYGTDWCGGGGGGSSYTHPDLCSEVTHTQGYQDGAGYITITEIG